MSSFPRFPIISPATRRAVSAAQTTGNASPMQFRQAPLAGADAAVVAWQAEQFQTLLDAFFRPGDLLQQPFIVGLAPIRLRPAEPRRYMFIQNQSAVNQLVLGLGKPPGAAGLLPVDGLIIFPNGGFYEPSVVPQKELWVVGSAANTIGMLIYSPF